MEMRLMTFLPKAGLLFAGTLLAACATVGNPEAIPDLVVQHTLSAVASNETFRWEEETGRVYQIRPLGTFKSGDTYCRDYEVSLDETPRKPVRRTACRIGNRWATVDPSTLDL